MEPNHQGTIRLLFWDTDQALLFCAVAANPQLFEALLEMVYGLNHLPEYCESQKVARFDQVLHTGIEKLGTET